MVAEKNLTLLLEQLEPNLLDAEYVFCSLKHEQIQNYQELKPLASFHESEGLSVILEKSQATLHKLEFEGTFHCISLSVHSSLEAVGLTAAVSSLLAKHQISVNIVAAFYHDHIFVPTLDATRALRLLEEAIEHSSW